MKNSKDPAFLFYSRDFYEGTRSMLPEERACYIDLLIYQHQYKLIPLDLKRVYMYCSGISSEIVDFVLNNKFDKTEDGYFNAKLLEVSKEREVFSKKQSENGQLGNFYKKAKTILSEADYWILKQELSKYNNSDALRIVNEFTTHSDTLSVENINALRTHLAIAINNNIYINKKEKIENLQILCLADNEWLNTIQDKLKIPIDKVIFALNDFNKHLLLIGKNEDKTIRDYKEYFVNWARKRKEANK